MKQPYVNEKIFLTGTSKVYRLAGNDWYAVAEDSEYSRVLLVDTDCQVAGEKLRTIWNGKDVNLRSLERLCGPDSDNGQSLLDYTNSLADKYFSEIKYAIIPRDINCRNKDGEGQGEIKGAYMWPMSLEEFLQCQNVSGRIVDNTAENLATRSFSQKKHDAKYVWGISNICSISNTFGRIEEFGASSLLAVAPAFFINTDAVDHLENNEKDLKIATVVLKPASELVTTK